MIIDYDHNPALTTDQKLQSLKESVQMALNEFETNNATSVQNDDDPNLAKTIIEDYTGSTLAGSSQSVKSAIDALDTSVDALDSAVDAIADYIVEQGTSGNWTYRKWNSKTVEAWYYGGSISYSGTNTYVTLPHTASTILSLTGNGILNGYAMEPLVNLWSNKTKVFFTIANHYTSGGTLDSVSIYAVYTVS